jgi:hypothetical protein
MSPKLQRLQAKLSKLYGLRCEYENYNFILYGPNGHSLLRIGTIGVNDRESLFGIGVADGACQTFHRVEDDE